MKDPAFLFYTNDFISGTQFFSDEQLGKYIRLLCAQHQHGHLNKKHILMICKRQDEDTDEILKKFDADSDGLFFNKRLEFEIHRRLQYSLSRSENRSKKRNKHKKKICKRYDKDMETVTVNEIEDINVLAVGGEKERFKNFKNSILSKQMVMEELAMKCELTLDDMPKLIDKFISHCITGGDDHFTEKDFQQHLRNWTISRMASLKQKKNVS